MPSILPCFHLFFFFFFAISFSLHVSLVTLSIDCMKCIKLLNSSELASLHYLFLLLLQMAISTLKMLTFELNRNHLTHSAKWPSLLEKNYSTCIADLNRSVCASSSSIHLTHLFSPQECPSGLVKEETFKMIYSQFFPRSDSHLYAHYIFNTFDPNHTGVITFTVSPV